MPCPANSNNEIKGAQWERHTRYDKCGGGAVTTRSSQWQWRHRAKETQAASALGACGIHAALRGKLEYPSSASGAPLSTPWVPWDHPGGPKSQIGPRAVSRGLEAYLHRPPPPRRQTRRPCRRALGKASLHSGGQGELAGRKSRFKGTSTGRRTRTSHEPAQRWPNVKHRRA